MPLPEPTSFQGQLDWLLLVDPTAPPSHTDEGRVVHLYFDRPVLEAYHTQLAIRPDDPERIGSAGWMANLLASLRAEPTMEEADRLQGYDRGAQAYAAEPPFLIQLRRYQMRLLAVFNDWGLAGKLEPPPEMEVGIDTYALMASNGHHGRHEQLAPLLMVTASVFDSIATVLGRDAAGLFGDFHGEGTWDERNIAGVIEQLSVAMKTAPETDQLLQAALCAIHCAATAAHEFGWLLHAEGPIEFESPMLLPPDPMAN